MLIANLRLRTVLGTSILAHPYRRSESFILPIIRGSKSAKALSNAGHISYCPGQRQNYRISQYINTDALKALPPMHILVLKALTHGLKTELGLIGTILGVFSYTIYK